MERAASPTDPRELPVGGNDVKIKVLSVSVLLPWYSR